MELMKLKDADIADPLEIFGGRINVAPSSFFSCLEIRTTS